MTLELHDATPTLASLRDKRDKVADRLSPDAAARARRALSWLERAQQETEDADAAFIFHWIAFSAVCAEYGGGSDPQLKGFFKKALAADERNAIQDVVLDEDVSDAILDLVANPYVFEPFWDCYNRSSDSADKWSKRLIDDVERVSVCLETGKSADALAAAFERLQVVHRQLTQGEATWNRRVNRSQVINGAEILSSLLPALMDVMMDNPDMLDSPSRYPSVESDTAQTVEDVQDYAIAANVMRRVRLGIEPVYSSDEVREYLDLDD